MRSIYVVALFATIFFSGWYLLRMAPPCLVPLTYHLGKVDTRFNLSTEEAMQLVRRGEKAWEDQMDRPLFIYDPNSTFTVNFIYDKRQSTSDAAETDKQQLDKKEVDSASVGSEYKKVLDQYNNLKSDYDQKTASYESRLSDFNNTVAEYNKKGGAPKEVFDKLKVTEDSLAVEATSLQSTSNKLAVLAKSINDLGEKGNSLISEYNNEVNTYNRNYGKSEEFTQGDYQGTSINIYNFKDKEELVNVLTHEFGHALGLPHVEGNTSIMYYLMGKQPNGSKLTDTDLAALAKVCRSNNDPVYRIENFFRGIFSKLNLI